MRRRFALLGTAIAAAAALVVLVGSIAFAQVPGGYGYGPNGYGTGGYGNGYGMMGRGMMGGYNSWGYQQAPNNGNGYYGSQPQAPAPSQGYNGWGGPMDPGMMGGYGGWGW